MFCSPTSFLSATLLPSSVLNKLHSSLKTKLFYHTLCEDFSSSAYSYFTSAIYIHLNSTFSTTSKSLKHSTIQLKLLYFQLTCWWQTTIFHAHWDLQSTSFSSFDHQFSFCLFLPHYSVLILCVLLKSFSWKNYLFFFFFAFCCTWLLQSQLWMYQTYLAKSS